MVQIPQYQQQVGLEAPNRSLPAVDTNVDNSIGRGLMALGGALSNAGEAAMQRQKRMNAFNTRVGFDALQERLGQGLIEMQRNAPADGQGLHDNFLKWQREEASKWLNNVTDPELRQQYGTVIDANTEHWSNEGANAEFKIANTYTVNALTDAQNKAFQGITADPTSVQKWTADMEERIKTAPNLEPAQREKLLQDFKSNAPVYAAQAVAAQDPEAKFFMDGWGTHEQRLSFLGRRLQAAVIAAESSGDPNAVSPTGAVGLMQVQPETAVDIAKKLGDKAFLGLTKEQQVEYLKNPATSKLYGTTYLNMMLQRYDGDVEAALVAYNAGPGNADKWLAAGRDWKALPKPEETQPYVQKVFDGMGAAKLVSGVSDRPATSSGGTRIPVQMGTQPGRQPARIEGVNRQVLGAWEQVQGQFGRALPVVSGYRDAATNAKAGGARHSQHMNGSALDIDVSGLSKQERVKLIQLASAKGFTGIGIYKNSIHLDMRKGAPVAWGSNHHAASVPAWAFHVAAQHREGAYGKGVQLADASGAGGLTMNDVGPQYADGVPGSAPRSGFVSPIYSDLPAADFLKITSGSPAAFAKAQQAQLAQQTADEILAAAGATDKSAGDSRAAYSALDAINNADLRKDVAALIDSHYTRWTRIEKDQKEELVRNTSAAVDDMVASGDVAGAYARLKSSGLEGEDYNRVMTRIAKGPVEFDDPKAVLDAAALRADPARFATTDVAKVYGNSLTAESLAKLVEDQGKVKETLAGKTDDLAKAQLATTNTAKGLIDENIKAIGIPTDSKAAPEDVQHANLVRAMALQELEARQAKNGGKPLLLSEINDAVSSVMKTYPRFKPIESSWMPWRSADADVSMSEVLKAFDDNKLDANQAAAALRKVGKPVNAATLQQALDDYLAMPKAPQ